MDPIWCFFMPWWSRDHPRLILDRFGKTYFFMKIFIFLTEILSPTFIKTHMYTHNLVNLRVPRPQATQNTKTKWNLSNSTEQMLRKTKNKIEKLTKSGTEDISKIQHPRKLLLSLSALRVMLDWKKNENNPKEPKRDRDHDLAIVSCHFLCQFLSLSLLSFFWCF